MTKGRPRKVSLIWLIASVVESERNAVLKKQKLWNLKQRNLGFEVGKRLGFGRAFYHYFTLEDNNDFILDAALRSSFA